MTCCVCVVICFQISIFEPLETAEVVFPSLTHLLWFAFKLVSLNHWKQRNCPNLLEYGVVICFQISIFEPLETTLHLPWSRSPLLWFAFKLVSLNHWKQPQGALSEAQYVVICFQISIFEPLETTPIAYITHWSMLWFAFKLVSLNHWKQQIEPAFAHSVRCDLLSN